MDGFAQGDTAKLVAGAILVALLALLTEVAFAAAERVVTPQTSSTARQKSPWLGRMRGPKTA